MSSAISSVLRFTGWLGFHIEGTLHDYFGFGSLFLRFMFLVIITSHLQVSLKEYHWYTQRWWYESTFDFIYLHLMVVWALLYAEKKQRWIIREWRLLRAFYDDVSAFRDAAQKVNMSHDLLDSNLLKLPSQPTEEEWLVDKVQRLKLSFADGSRSRGFLRNLTSAAQDWYKLSIKNDILHHFERSEIYGNIDIYGALNKSRSLLWRLQLVQDIKAVEDDSGSTAVRNIASLASSVVNRIDCYIDYHLNPLLLILNVKNPIQGVRLKVMLLEALFKDLECVKFETATEKAWVEEVQVLMSEIDQAVDRYIQRMRKTGLNWFFNLKCWSAWILLLAEMDSALRVFDYLTKQKRKYGFKFTRRQLLPQQKQVHPYQKDIDDVNELKSLLNQICNETSFDIDSEVVTNLGKLLEKMRVLLEEVVAIGAGNNLRLFCVEQVRNIRQMAESALEACRSSSKWKRLSEVTKLYKPMMDDLDRSVKAYNIEQRPDTIVGLEVDTDTLVSQLTTSDGESFIFSIVGMRGIGKTTLAKKVYRHRTLLSHFPGRAWVSVPEGCNDINVLMEEVGKQITGIHDLVEEGKGKEYWVQKIQGFLRQEERYLVVLDNVSTMEVWDMLKDAFPQRTSNGRILLTTRHKSVALHADQNSNPHFLRLRTKEQSWESFKESAQFQSEQYLSEEEVTRKLKEAVGTSGGLPLTIACLGFLMSESETIRINQKISRVVEQISRHRGLWSENFSNNDLSHLKEFLSLFTLFPKNYEIPVRRLIALWVAKGPEQQSTDGKTPEQRVEEYISELIHLNIIQPVKNNIDGKAKICCLPVSLWDDVVSTSKNEDHGDNNDAKLILDAGTSPPAQPRRYKNLVSLISFNTGDGNKPGEDIGNFLSRGIANGCFRKLGVLDLEHVFRPRLPNTIGKLEELRYLGLRWTYLEEIPSSIGNLTNLQTLDLKHTYIRTLPQTMWKLEKLGRLYLNNTHQSEFMHQFKTRTMKNLHTLWGIFLDENSPLKHNIDKLESLRKLKLTFQLGEQDQKELAKRIAKLHNLQSLRLSSIDVKGKSEKLHAEDYLGLEHLSHVYLFGRLENAWVLRKLSHSLCDITLSDSRLQEDPMAVLGDLDNLRSLRLFCDSFTGERMVCSARKFRNLYMLKLWKLGGLEEWRIEKEAMENLKVLEIRCCQSLKVPNGLRHLKTLRELKLTSMEAEFTATLVENRGPVWDNISHVPDIICE